MDFIYLEYASSFILIRKIIIQLIINGSLKKKKKVNDLLMEKYILNLNR